jgi:hypothetical protein
VTAAVLLLKLRTLASALGWLAKTNDPSALPILPLVAPHGSPTYQASASVSSVVKVLQIA